LKEAKKNGEYRVQFEHKHEDKIHQVNTMIAVKKIQKVTLPKLDDGFIAKITKDKFTTVDALRANLREDIISYWKEKSERQVINSITAEIIRRHEFPVPESLIRSVLAGLLEEVKNEYPNKQLPAEFNIGKFNEENRAYAIYQSKWALLREELIKAENITVSDDDLKKLAELESTKIKIPTERLINYYKSSDQIKDRIIGDKLLRILIDSAKIKEVPEKVTSK
jgi:trigger factor